MFFSDCFSPCIILGVIAVVWLHCLPTPFSIVRQTITRLSPFYLIFIFNNLPLNFVFAVLKASGIPVVLVENSVRCNKNESDEKVRRFSHDASLYCLWVQWCKTFSSADWVDARFLVTQVLPNGIAWIPQLVQTITQVALNKSESIHVDKKLIDGPNPNQTGKWWIPLIIAAQVSFLNSRAYTVFSFLYWILTYRLINSYSYFLVNSISLS